MIRHYFDKKGFRVSSAEEDHSGNVIVRFPDGGPEGLPKMRIGPLTLQLIEKDLLGINGK
jgi:hypothetical protein